MLLVGPGSAPSPPTSSSTATTGGPGGQRFDRTPQGAQLAVEDACQALDRYPADQDNLPDENACRGLADMTDAAP